MQDQALVRLAQDSACWRVVLAVATVAGNGLRSALAQQHPMAVKTGLAAAVEIVDRLRRPDAAAGSGRS
jgi:hypothetical protein